ncbi:lantibiotic dehydratase family protein [Aquimarina sp. 2201CG5-10]|uniref:lantibiotic dehydratase family protein n=1 Tax=Aquimarina callyspongiae TaxID=3098150 RepID=UPI002AB505DB|nr:lantibiotic dehydratase family protein [Aquimarina sp. 2201CG5-10]MDY8137084.1 lantibiotic dehydratase family protein [Aquimarina sp. 2201CG5-10]
MTYKNFSKYVLRTSLFSFSFYKKLTQNDSINEEELKQICNDDIIKEAIFLASPSLYSEFEKWLSGDIKDSNKSDRMLHSVLKYISRMSSRCTPFGLFAGTAVGEFSDETSIALKHKSQNKRHTRLDMNYLVALSQDIVKDSSIREQLLFYPNTSIYKAGHQLRYVEYTYVNSRRVHHIIAVENSEYLQKVIEKAKKGALLLDLAEVLVDDEITIEDARGFIDELVDSQLLISELEPSVSGPEFLEQIIPVLRKLKNTESIISTLENAKETLDSIDNKIGNSSKDYIALSEALEKLGTGFELKYMFQTDMSINPETNTIDKEILHKVRKAITLLNKITFSPKETLVHRFRNGFYERYEDREVPLSMALDVELGVGFKQGQDSGDVSKIIDDVILPIKKQDTDIDTIHWSPIHAILHKKLLKSIEEQSSVIEIKDDDFDQFSENWEDLPDTISTMVELVTIDDQEKIVMSNIGGSSAANLLGRFCHSDPDIFKYTQEMIDLEKQMNPNKILAEIVHLPESRAGNILMRPALREYEIPYLAKSILNPENQLSLDDLVLSARPLGKVKLISKKHKKEVIPHLTNAHNFSSGALPIYEFLANMQTQGQRGGVGFNWGPLVNEYKFLPRVEYRGVVLSKATWNISEKEIKQLLQYFDDEDLLLQEMQKIKEKRKIPKYVLLIEGDNELLINTDNSTSIKMFLSTVKKRTSCTLKEFLHTEEGIVKNNDETHTNQVVLSFYNAKKLKRTTANGK